MEDYRPLVRLISILVGCVLCQGCLQGRRAWEHPRIVNRLKALDGVIVESAAISDGNLGSTHAILRVHGRGLLALSGLTLDSFEPGAPLVAYRVGENWIYWVGFGNWGVIDRAGRPTRGAAFGGGVDLSVNSPFRSILPVHGNTIQDVVSAYEDILRTIAEWPDCPKAASLVGADGTDYRYCSKRGSVEESRFSLSPHFERPQYPPEWDRPWEMNGLTSTGADAVGYPAR